MRDHTESDLTVQTTSGPAHGFLDRGTPNWRGVPYGRIERRFRPPVPAEPAGRITAHHWGPVSWQLPIQLGTTWALVPLDDVEDEQCLNLNIWSTGSPRDEPRPVLVWLHAGGRVYGSGRTWVDPWHLAARQGAVVVTANYRLGPWGWLYLGGHDPAFKDSANLAILDQVLLLRWVRENIAGFGGDPANVTLFGMSSGGSDVATLLATPSARGLFHQAAVYSGNAEAPIPREEAVRFAGEFLAAAGPLASTPEDLVRLPNAGLRHIHRKLLEQGATVRYGPVVDGDVLPEQPLDAIGAPRGTGGPDVPVLVSVTSDEAGLYAGFGEAAVDRTYDMLVGGDPSLDQDEKIRRISRTCFWEPADRLVRAVHRSGGSVWAQEFAYAPTTSHFARTNPHLASRPVHGTDTAALFADPEGTDGTAADRIVAAREQDALMALARHGRPRWEPWTPQRPVTHRIAAPR
ncbi:putative TMC biosynthetic enzyme L1 [Actinacidiphila reveromycinica]|uniref:Carboxylic ester hydrolase n=1 Tax=Actinacidiphila reveromycinica TaxID=659352 RepID=A0A7U3UR93_9ACTN|nr:carboxylesterase family protein [Streptomyces sp. SN-593]BBA97274.1 putative TMC biosynthetic enzyme L1 [Streptomyces sp. SN-593]